MPHQRVILFNIIMHVHVHVHVHTSKWDVCSILCTYIFVIIYIVFETKRWFDARTNNTGSSVVSKSSSSTASKKAAAASRKVCLRELMQHKGTALHCVAFRNSKHGLVDHLNF